MGDGRGRQGAAEDAAAVLGNGLRVDEAVAGADQMGKAGALLAALGHVHEAIAALGHDLVGLVMEDGLQGEQPLGGWLARNPCNAEPHAPPRQKWGGARRG